MGPRHTQGRGRETYPSCTIDGLGEEQMMSTHDLDILFGPGFSRQLYGLQRNVVIVSI